MSDAADAKPPLALIIQSGAVDRVHYALLFAAGALAMGRDVTLFFTMAGCRAFNGVAALLPAEDGTSAAACDPVSYTHLTLPTIYSV